MSQIEEDSEMDGDTSHGIDFPKEVTVNNFSTVEDFVLSVDIDSLYFGNHDLGRVVAGLGSKSIFNFNWMLDRRSCTSQSRFSVTTRKVEKEFLPLRVHGKKPLVVALHRFRNVTLFKARIPNFNNSEIRIHLYWLFSEKMPMGNNYFSDYQLIAICFLLNKSRMNALSDASDQHEQHRQYQELSHVPMLCHYQSGKAGHFYSNSGFQLSYDSMCLWADQFDNQLLCSSKSTFTDFVADFKDCSSLGACVMKENSELALLSKVYIFLKSLYAGRHFTATMAGAKSDFVSVTDSEFEIPIEGWANSSSSDSMSLTESSMSETSDHELMLKLIDLQTRACSRLRSSLDIEETKNRLGNTFRQMSYYIDFGVEIAPNHENEESFFLLAETAKTFVESWLKLDVDSTPDETMSLDSEITNVHHQDITLEFDDQKLVDVISSFGGMEFENEDDVSGIGSSLEGECELFRKS